MNIFAILVIKNEIDVVRECLRAASDWADRIFVLDNGSTDGTWEAVTNMENKTVVPWKQDFGPFRRSLRGDVFNRFREEATEGDWWCYKLDVDEFYIDDPKDFLRRVPRRFHLVRKKSIDYVITPEDLEEHEFTENFEHNRELIRYVKPVAYTEGRFFRHRSRLTWPADRSAPEHVGIAYPKPILARHYQYRSPTQMEKRLSVRRAIPKDSSGAPFRHVTESNWREMLYSRQDCVLDQGAATYKSLPIDKSVRDSLPSYLRKRLFHALGIYP
jgi:glycosyltransferase involved in cell wall biosynthesis